ncbi:MAG: hypothetical protein J1F35_01695 [Erysipelotrichales bacterium]|nr:hypothetical protein [Erysipelotrichales bacterium]
MYKRNKFALDKWSKEIESYERLTITEAQELYSKAISTEDTELKKSYMNRLILGTLYVVCNYIERNDLIKLCTTEYDMNDMINSFTEAWIKNIYDGKLLDITMFSNLLRHGFFSEVYKNLGCSEVVVNDQFDMSSKLFVDLFYRYIECRNNNKKFYYEDILGDIETYYDSIKVPMIMPLFEKMYNRLNIDKNESLAVVKTRLDDFLKYYINIGLCGHLNPNISDECDYEDETIYRVGLEHFIEDVDAVFEDDPRSKDMLHLVYGLDDDTPMTLKSVGDIYNLSRDRVRQINGNSLRRLRSNDKIREYNSLRRNEL